MDWEVKQCMEVNNKLEQILSRMKECISHNDIETNHITADELLIELIETIREDCKTHKYKLKEILETYKNVPKFYS